MQCQCDIPMPHKRPSGVVVCQWCGGRIEPKPTKKERA